MKATAEEYRLDTTEAVLDWAVAAGQAMDAMGAGSATLRLNAGNTATFIAECVKLRWAVDHAEHLAEDAGEMYGNAVSLSWLRDAMKFDVE